MALKPRQQKFVQLYLAGHSATEAYVKAGYKAKRSAAGACAEKLLKKAQVKRLVDEAQEKGRQGAVATVKYVVETLTEVVERCMGRKPYPGRDGADETRADHRTAVAAAKILGEHLGMFAPKPDAAADENRNGVTVEQLTRILAVVGARHPRPGAAGGGAGGTGAGNPVVPERGAAEPRVPE
jgi:hypothetical protein